MLKFKIGDKVRYNGARHDDAPCYYPKTGTIGKILEIEAGDGLDLKVQWPSGSTSKDDIWWCSSENVSCADGRNVIVIRIDKDNYNRVIATDKSTGKTADAKCNPGDEFDFYKGAKLAFKRLVGDMDEAEVRPSKKCKFKVGDIIIGNEKANRYGITVKGWVGEVTEVHEPKPGYGCDAGFFKTFKAKSVTSIPDTNYDLDDDCFDLAANSR